MFCHCYWLVSESTEWWGAGMVICLEQGADLHMAQLMPLPLTVSCFSKIYIGFTFVVVAYPRSPGKGPLNGCVCVWLVSWTTSWLSRQFVCCFWALCYFSLWTFVCLQVSCFSVYIPWCSHQQLYSYDTCGWNCHWLSSAFSSNSQRTCLASAVVTVRCWQDYVGCSGSTAIYGHDAVAMLWINVAYCVKLSGRDLSYYTTTTTAVSWPLYRSTCIIRHLQSRTGGFCWCKVLLPTCPCWWETAHSD